MTLLDEIELRGQKRGRRRGEKLGKELGNRQAREQALVAQLTDRFRPLPP
ncbi:MAG: hypothetical protein R3F14_04620 [Polyangiaceae bacterium]